MTIKYNIPMPVPFALLKQHRVHRHPILHKFLLLLVCVLFSALVLFKSVTCDQVTLSKCIFKCYLFIFFFLDHTFLFPCRFYLPQTGILAILNILATVFSSFHAYFVISSQNISLTWFLLCGRNTQCRFLYM